MFKLVKIPGVSNGADLMTKFVDKATLQRHQAGTGFAGEYQRGDFALSEQERINDVTDLED
eukprot:1199377-Amphidinium_carterae.1